MLSSAIYYLWYRTYVSYIHSYIKEFSRSKRKKKKEKNKNTRNHVMKAGFLLKNLVLFLLALLSAHKMNGISPTLASISRFKRKSQKNNLLNTWPIFGKNTQWKSKTLERIEDLSFLLVLNYKIRFLCTGQCNHKCQRTANEDYLKIFSFTFLLWNQMYSSCSNTIG